MSVRFIAPVRGLFRVLSAEDAADLARDVRAHLSMTAEEIYDRCRSFILSRLPENGSFSELLERPGT